MGWPTTDFREWDGVEGVWGDSSLSGLKAVVEEDALPWEVETREVSGEGGVVPAHDASMVLGEGASLEVVVLPVGRKKWGRLDVADLVEDGFNGEAGESGG